MSRLRLIFVVLFMTGVLIAIVHLRTASSRIFYRYRIANVEQARLSQQLHDKFLHLESLINPQAVQEHARPDEGEDSQEPQ